MRSLQQLFSGRYKHRSKNASVRDREALKSRFTIYLYSPSFAKGNHHIFPSSSPGGKAPEVESRSPTRVATYKLFNIHSSSLHWHTSSNSSTVAIQVFVPMSSNFSDNPWTFFFAGTAHLLQRRLCLVNRENWNRGVDRFLTEYNLRCS